MYYILFNITLKVCLKDSSFMSTVILFDILDTDWLSLTILSIIENCYTFVIYSIHTYFGHILFNITLKCYKKK